MNPISDDKSTDTPKEWSSLLRDSAYKLPPKSALLQMTRYWNDALNGFGSRCKKHERCVSNKERFSEAAAKGEAPSEVLIALKGLPDSASSGQDDNPLEEDSSVVTLRDEYETALKAARTAATAYLEARFAAEYTQEEAELRQAIIDRRSKFAASCSEDAEQILTSIGVEPLMWSPFINAVSTMLEERLTNIRVEYASRGAAVRKEATRKQEEALLVAEAAPEAQGADQQTAAEIKAMKQKMADLARQVHRGQPSSPTSSSQPNKASSPPQRSRQPSSSKVPSSNSQRTNAPHAGGARGSGGNAKGRDDRGGKDNRGRTSSTSHGK